MTASKEAAMIQIGRCDFILMHSSCSNRTQSGVACVDSASASFMLYNAVLLLGYKRLPFVFVSLSKTSGVILHYYK